jgi:hypothetical protein
VVGRKAMTALVVALGTVGVQLIGGRPLAVMGLTVAASKIVEID